MPAANVSEARYTVPVQSAYQQIDIAGRGGAAPTNRYKVRIVNTGTSRVNVAVSMTDPGSGVVGEAIEADYGIWEDFVEPNVPIWARVPSGSSCVIVFRQYALG